MIAGPPGLSVNVGKLSPSPCVLVLLLEKDLRRQMPGPLEWGFH